MICLFLALSFLQQVGVRTTSAEPIRLPLQKQSIEIKSPAKYERRVIGQDGKTGQLRYYDPKPRVILFDGRSKKYGLRWIGYDGKEKTIIYQRPDAVDVVVTASVVKTADGKYIYNYRVMNLASSAEYISTFALQNYSYDVTPRKNELLYIGTITRNKHEFKDGSWMGFSVLSTTITPGRHFDVTVVSSAPPGLVECRVAGVLGMKGVGEEPPQELEDMLPGYEIWPRGFTLGPHDWLMTASRPDRITYLKALLPRMHQLGWLTERASAWYQQNLGGNRPDEILRHARDDFKSGEITSEVHDIIETSLK